MNMIAKVANSKALCRPGLGYVGIRKLHNKRIFCILNAAENKNVLITGGNTGIGLETAKSLCRKGYSVCLACRDDEKAKNAVQSLLAEVPSASITTTRLDLADLSSVRDCAAKLLDDGTNFDVILNNAGVMACPRMLTKDGYEYQLGVNHLGHFLLTNLLLISLKQGSKKVRIVNVSSAAHTFGSINFSDLMLERSYQPWVSYNQSKLANVLFTYELARRLGPTSPISVNALHPGVVRTELGRYMMEDPLTRLFVPLAFLFFKSPEQGAETSIFLASSPNVENQTSKYFVDCKPVSSSPASYDLEASKKLWELSEELTKLDSRLASL